jgi:hypothetical protein
MFTANNKIMYKKISNPIVNELIESVSSVTNKPLDVRVSILKTGTSIKFNNLNLYGTKKLSVKRSMARKGFKLVKQDYSSGKSSTRRNSVRGIRFVYQR